MSPEMGAVFLAGRIIFVISFVAISGVGHLKGASGMTQFAKSSGFPLPVVAGIPAGLWLIAAGVSVAAGIWGDLGALMLGLFVVLAALGFHRFWELEDAAQRQTQSQAFFRNVTYLGADLALFAIYAGIGEGLRFTVTGPLFDLASTP